MSFLGDIFGTSESVSEQVRRYPALERRMRNLDGALAAQEAKVAELRQRGSIPANVDDNMRQLRAAAVQARVAFFALRDRFRAAVREARERRTLSDRDYQAIMDAGLAGLGAYLYTPAAAVSWDGSSSGTNWGASGTFGQGKGGGGGVEGLGIAPIVIIGIGAAAAIAAATVPAVWIAAYRLTQESVARADAIRMQTDASVEMWRRAAEAQQQTNPGATLPQLPGVPGVTTPGGGAGALSSIADAIGKIGTAGVVGIAALAGLWLFMRSKRNG